MPENYTKYEPPLRDTSVHCIPQPPYFLDPKDPHLNTILLSSCRFDADYYVYQYQLHLLKRMKEKQKIPPTQMNIVKFFNHRYDFENLVSPFGGTIEEQ